MKIKFTQNSLYYLSMPLIIVGSIFMIIQNFPISTDQHAAKQFLGDLMSVKYREAINIVNMMFMNVIAIVVAYSVGASLGKQYGFDRLMCGVLGFVGYILWVFPVDIVPAIAKSTTATVGGSLSEVFLSSDLTENGGLSFKALGSGGMFAGIIGSIAMIELYRFTSKYRITIRLPKQVPSAISNSFLIISPILIYGIFVYFAGYVGGFDLINGLNLIFSPLEKFLTSNLFGVMLLAFLITGFWSVGLHGVAIFNAVVRPIWTKIILDNASLFDTWKKGYYPKDSSMAEFPEQFLQWTVWIGGAGATLGLVIVALIFAKSKQLRAVSKASIIPGIFNINEPVIFGFPIMLNVFMIIPFVLAPQALIVSSYLFQHFVFNYHWIAVAPWTLPAPLGAFFSAGSTAGSQWGVILVTMINLLISCLIYFPFLKIYDKQLVQEENARMIEEGEKNSIVDSKKLVRKEK